MKRYLESRKGQPKGSPTLSRPDIGPSIKETEPWPDPPTRSNKDDIGLWVSSISQKFRALPKRTVRPKESEDSSLVIVLSDIHYGKLTPTFNADICKARLLSMPEQLLSKFELPVIDEIVLILLGDLVEGEEVFPGQVHSIEMPLIEQVRGATENIWEMLLLLAKYFPEAVLRVETCHGNHGRVSRHASPLTNWDNLIHQSLGLLAARDLEKRIQVNVNLEPFLKFSVKGKNGFANHYGVKHLGTPSMQVKVAGWLDENDFDFMIAAHWHKWEIGTQFGRILIKNGSLCGPDELSERMAVFDPPRQAFFFVTEGSPIWGNSFFEWPGEF